MSHRLPLLLSLGTIACLVGCSAATGSHPDLVTASTVPEQSPSAYRPADLDVVTGGPPRFSRRVIWNVVNPNPGEQSVTLTWQDSGGPACGQVGKAYLQETPTQVQITLVQAKATASGACAPTSITRQGRVPLASPLASRAIVHSPA